MAKPLTTPAQRAMLRQLHQLRPDGWARANCHGDRVTLASLYYRGFADRRAWRGEGTSSPAYEYRMTDQLREAIDARQAS